MNVAIDQIYPARIETARRLLGADAPGDAETLRACAHRLRDGATLLGRAPVAVDWQTYADAVDIVALLIDWQQAVRDAQADADRFVRAARLRLKEIEGQTDTSPFTLDLAARLSVLNGEPGAREVREVRRAVGTARLPLTIFADPKPVRPSWAQQQEVQDPPADEVAVAFLEFRINGDPVETVQSLPAGQMHDLDLTIRVSRWPDTAQTLLVAPISIEPPSMWDFPIFAFPRPDSEPPFILQGRGRMMLHARQGINARPLEFRYAAEFQPLDRDEPILIAGQRTLLLDGSPAAAASVTGDASVDRQITRLRDRMRHEPRIAEDDLRDVLILLSSIGNLMWQSVKANHYPEPISEAEFQRDFQRHLRANPAIGMELEEQAIVAGGKSDLTYRGIRIELKSERTKPLSPADCEQYAAQAASYAVGTGRNVALLCVLDCSPKSTVAFPTADGLTIIPVATATAPVYVVSCLIQGNLARPSDFSR